MNGRIDELDIIKGICIIGIVFSHAGHPLLWLSYFYLFAFYFVAGFTYHDRPCWEFLFSKIKRLYIPFVASNLFAGMVCVFLRKYTNYACGGYPWHRYVFSILQFNLRESIMAPSWFLFPLFCVSLIFFILRKIGKRSDICCLFSFIIFIIAIHYRQRLCVVQWNNCALVINLAVGLFVYACGYMCKENMTIKNYIGNGKYKFDCFLAAFLLLCEAKDYWNYHIDLRAGIISSGKWMLITYMAGMYVLFCFSKIVSERGTWSKKVLIYIGKKSMSIMFFHVMCFNIVTLIGIYILKISYEPSWTNAIYGKWFGYANAIIGVTLPLLAGFLSDRLNWKNLR